MRTRPSSGRRGGGDPQLGRGDRSRRGGGEGGGAGGPGRAGPRCGEGGGADTCGDPHKAGSPGKGPEPPRKARSPGSAVEVAGLSRPCVRLRFLTFSRGFMGVSNEAVPYCSHNRRLRKSYRSRRNSLEIASSVCCHADPKAKTSLL